MSGLREKQRAKRRQQILAAASELFSTKGYAATKMEEIAETAEVGVATVYNYFGVKEALIRELWRPEIDAMRTAGKLALAMPVSSAGGAMAALIDQYKFGEGWQRRDLLLAIAGLDLGYAEIFQGIRYEVDELVTGQIAELLSILEKKRLLRKGIDHDDLVALIYGVLNMHFQLYAVHEEMSLASIRESLHRRILLLFEPWVSRQRA